MSIKLPNQIELPGSPDLSVQLQPAGVDFSVESIAQFAGQGVLDFSNQRRRLPELQAVLWHEGEDGESFAELAPGAYLVTYNETISVPLDSAGIILPRSSLMRCGATLCSALWDPGYTGRGQGLMLVHAPLRLFRNARIGQFVLFSLESAAAIGYTGTYQGENAVRPE